jgi:hypothetical protein
LTVNDEFTASIVISRSIHTAAGAIRWKIRVDSGLQPDITVALRMDAANRAVVDYYLLPRIGTAAAKLRLREENGFSLDAYRFDSLESFFYLARAGRREGRRSAAKGTSPDGDDHRRLERAYARELSPARRVRVGNHMKFRKSNTSSTMFGFC